MLVEFGTFALRCIDRAALLEGMARQAASALGADRSLIALRGADADLFRVEAVTGWPQDMIGQPLAPDGMAFLAATTGEPTAGVDDVSRDQPPPPGLELLRRHGLRSALAVPVGTDNSIVGVIELASTELRSWDDGADLLRGFASLFGAALDRLTADARRNETLAQREEELRRYRFMAEMLPQIVWSAQPNGIVDYYNQRWTHYTGLPAYSGKEGEWADALHPDDKEQTLEVWLQAVATGQAYETEHRIRRAGGGWRWMLSRAWPMRDETGRIVRWFGTATDIDAEKQAQQALAAARDAAERANRAKSRFLAAASHDLRQPLNAFSLLVGTLRARLSEPRNVTVVEQLEDSLAAMIELFEGLLDLSKLESEAVQLDVRPVGVPALFAKLERDFGPTADAKGLELRMRPLNLRVLSDGTLLERILRNLLANAIRYTDQGGVLVALRRRGNRVRIDIVDTGTGIPEEHLEDIFQEFQQLGNPARERGGGHGIGLAIVRRAADLLNHPITVRSRPGRGSRFSIELPVTTEPEPGAPQPGARVGRPTLQEELTVLLLEDDSLVMMATRLLLEATGCKVLEARTAAESLSLVRGGALPDLILTDYRLPGEVDGLEAVRRLRDAAALPLPAVLITGDVADEVEPLARAAEVRLLRKPVKPEELRQLVQRVRDA